MYAAFALGMTRATELTLSGRLDQATAEIWSLWLTPLAAAGQSAGGDVIDVALTSSAGAATPVIPRAARSVAREDRTGLGETLRGIAAGGMPPRGELTSMADGLPAGAQFLSLTHSGAESRVYRLYIPASRPDGPMPLIVMLHGCSQSPEDFAIGTGMNLLAEQFGCLIVWPTQPQGANVQKCWNWYRPEDQTRDGGEPALIAGIVGDVLRDHPADPARVYVAGLSAGGAAAAILGAVYPELFAAIGVHSGLPVGGAQDVASAFAAMRGGSRGNVQSDAVPAIVFHGLSDSTVHPMNGDAVVAQALEARPGLERVSVAGISGGGRTYRQTRHDDDSGRSMSEHWEIEGAGHAWAGGLAAGSFTDPKGPDASLEMMRFFLQHTRA